MKKNILLLIPSLEFGGAQRSISKLSIELAKNHNVYIAIFNKNIEPAFPVGGSLITLNVPGGKNIILKIYYFIQRCRITRKYKKKLRIESCISYMDGANYVNILSKAQEKTIISVRGSQLHDETIQGKIGFVRLRIFIPLLYRFADEIVALNHGIKRELVDFAKAKASKIKVISNFYDTLDINHKAREPIEPELQTIFSNNKIVVTAGRLAPEKGLAHLLCIFSKLKDQLSNVKLVIIGDGVLRNELTSTARNLNLSYFANWEGDKTTSKGNFDIFFIGYNTNPFKYIARADVFTLTSSSEGGPNILSEAMVCGTPVVSVDCPSGPREKLTSILNYKKSIQKAEYADYGILMPTLFPRLTQAVITEWVDTLKRVLEDKSLREHYAKKGKERMNSFTREAIFKLWESVI